MFLYFEFFLVNWKQESLQARKILAVYLPVEKAVVIVHVVHLLSGEEVLSVHHIGIIRVVEVEIEKWEKVEKKERKECHLIVQDQGVLIAWRMLKVKIVTGWPKLFLSKFYFYIVYFFLYIYIHIFFL